MYRYEGYWLGVSTRLHKLSGGRRAYKVQKGNWQGGCLTNCLIKLRAGHSPCQPRATTPPQYHYGQSVGLFDQLIDQVETIYSCDELGNKCFCLPPATARARWCTWSRTACMSWSWGCCRQVNHGVRSIIGPSPSCAAPCLPLMSWFFRL